MNVQIRFLCATLLLATTAAAMGQTTTARTQPKPPAISDSEKAFADSLAKMTLEEAKAAIAQAPPEKITVGVAQALQALGYIAIQSVQHPEPAIDLYFKGFYVATRAGDAKLAASLMFRVGNGYRFSGDNDNALASYSRAETLSIASHSPASDMANIHAARAVLRMDVGDLDGSMEDGQAALQEFKQTGDEAGMARALNNLGNTELARGEFSAARQEYEAGLVLARKSHQRLGESFLLNNISNTYLQQDNTLLATDYCLQSIKIKEELGNKETLAVSLMNLARIYQNSGQTAEALKTVQRASVIANEVGQPMNKALVLSVWGSIETDQKHYTIALEKLREGYALTQPLDDRMHGNEMLVQIATAEMDNGQYQDALRDATQALADAKAMRFEKNIESSAGVVGMSQKFLGHPREAAAALESAIAAVEEMREYAAGGDQGAATFFSSQMDVYHALAAVDAGQGRWEEAFTISEREKGRALLDVLTHGKSAAETDLTAKEKNELSKLRTRASRLTRNARQQQQPTRRISRP